MWTAGFPEPRTFSRRVLRLLRERAGDFDVVHDNQTLGSPLLGVEEATGLPLVASVHHPISIDRRIDLASAPDVAEAAHAASLVRLRPDAGTRRARHADGADAVGVLARPTSSASSASTRTASASSCSASTTASCHRPSPASPAGSWRWPAPTRR